MGRHRDNGRDYAPFEDDYRGFDVREDDSTRAPSSGTRTGRAYATMARAFRA